MQSKYLHPADQLIMIMQRIYDRGLTTTSGGNLSIKDENGDIWITPSGIDKGSLTRADIMQVKPDGTIIGRHTPSVELPFHSHIYQIRPDIHAILHAHPPYVVAYSLARKIPDLSLLAGLKAICGDVVMADYEVPGSEKLGNNIAKRFVEGYSTVMMENHGCVIGQSSIFDCYRVFEALEFAAKMEIGAKKLGNIHSLTQDQINAYASDASDKQARRKAVTSEECALRRDLCSFAKRSYMQGLFTASQGVYSARLSDGTFLMTPEGQDPLYLDSDDILHIKDAASLTAKRIKAVYDANPDIGSIVCTYAPNIMAFGASQAEFASRTIPESYIQLRKVVRLPFMPDMDTLSRSFSTSTPIVLVENDCAIVSGKNILNAFDRLEVLEFSAREVILTHDIAPLIRISDKEVHDIEQAFNL